MKSLRERLIGLDFSPYEADVYLALLPEYPVNGSQLARRSGVPRSMVYQTLDRLVEKGAVLIAPGDPSLYAPVPPKAYFGSLKERFAAVCDSLAEALPDDPSHGAVPLVWNLKGYAAIRTKAQELAGRAGGQLRTGGHYLVLEAILPSAAAAFPARHGGAPVPPRGSCALVWPSREALLLHADADDEPVAVYGSQPALVAAAMAFVAQNPVHKSRFELVVPRRQIW